MRFHWETIYQYQSLQKCVTCNSICEGFILNHFEIHQFWHYCVIKKHKDTFSNLAVFFFSLFDFKKIFPLIFAKSKCFWKVGNMRRFLGVFFKEFSKVLEIPTLSKLQKFGEGGDWACYSQIAWVKIWTITHCLLPKVQQKLTAFLNLVEEGLGYVRLFLELPKTSWSQ